MIRAELTGGWTVAPRVNVFEQVRDPAVHVPVTLPHDAMIGMDRDPGADGRTGYFPGALAVEYTRTLHAAPDWAGGTVALRFDGVYRNAMVFVDDQFVAQNKGGYTPFTVELGPHLRYGQDNVIRVEARVNADSRWYSGAGIIRDVFLIVTGAVHLRRTGPIVTTPDVDAERAVVEVQAPLVSTARTTRTVQVEVELHDHTGTVLARDAAPVTITPGEGRNSRHRLYLPRPRRWSVDDPYLYRAVVRVHDQDGDLDAVSVPLGVRTLRLDPVHGLRVNDESVKLRGACVHHDNGLIGAATIGRADERRAELLKAAGFNAIRSAHNPISPAMLDACDRLGMLVVDEAFDVWTEGKTSFDGATDFPEWWERNLEAMVLRDINHPSVVMYSIGNENVETGTPLGAALSHRLTEKIRELDGTRFVTNGVNPLVTLIRQNGERLRRAADLPTGGVNELLDAADGLDAMVTSDEATRRTREALAALDVAGLNYAEARYVMENDLHPDRIIVGTETAPRRIAHNWRLVLGDPRIIGDFTWTGYDYLGEVGIGRVRFPDSDDTGFQGPFPWISAWCGDLDLTGHRRPQSYYREIVFGLRPTPYLVVERPSSRERGATQGQWSWLDAIASWTWDVPPGTVMTVEVYSPDADVELFLNGTSLGRRATEEFRAVFDVPYQPGELTAAGTAGRFTLRTAGPAARAAVHADRTTLTAGHTDLAFLTIELVDRHGVPVPDDDRDVTVTVDGTAVLQGLGSARPDPQPGREHLTFDGRALAVVRPTGPGTALVTVRAAGLPEQTVEITVIEEI
ncbi:glycoside hydrolase family 2 TIM barrel-domain containing protein [Actinoplanes couchii]|uniref:Beta-galactosidase n=1 Tax=Actinoplanes couchii TaxID=403638 RepID=A0ABQ3XP45_9ACTN|nr:beta-galactosidase [Actinoplanes couchii]